METGAGITEALPGCARRGGTNTTTPLNKWVLGRSPSLVVPFALNHSVLFFSKYGFFFSGDEKQSVQNIGKVTVIRSSLLSVNTDLFTYCFYMFLLEFLGKLQHKNVQIKTSHIKINQTQRLNISADFHTAYITILSWWSSTLDSTIEHLFMRLPTAQTKKIHDRVGLA